MLLSFNIINTCNHLYKVEARTAWKGNCLHFVFELYFFLFCSPPPRPSSWLSRLRDPGSVFLRVCFSALNAGLVRPEVQTGFIWILFWNRGCLVEQDVVRFFFFLPFMLWFSGFLSACNWTRLCVCSSLFFWQLLLLGLSKVYSAEANLYSLWRAMSTTLTIFKTVLPEERIKIPLLQWN